MRKRTIFIKRATVILALVCACTGICSCGSMGKVTNLNNEESSEVVSEDETGNDSLLDEGNNTDNISIENGETEPTTEVQTVDVTELSFALRNMSAKMYAMQLVNVRSGPDSTAEKVGSLNANQEVLVTGQAESGWYRIEYNGTSAYVSNAYLASRQVAVNEWTGAPMYTVTEKDGKNGYFATQMLTGTETVVSAIESENNVKNTLDTTIYGITNPEEAVEIGWQSENQGMFNVNGVATYVWFIYRV